MRRDFDCRNFAALQFKREINESYNRIIQDSFTVTENFIDRLGLYGELEEHTGCVNCLEWNEDGSILASGSDDLAICLWSLKKKLLLNHSTGHTGNIFTTKFVPNTESRNLITGAADHSIRVHDISAKEVIKICTCHAGRVKRCATDLTVPHLFWSAGEDGLIIQHDLREGHICTDDSVTTKPTNVLIDLKLYTGQKAEVKCLAINPTRPNYIAVGANDCYARIYDRRFIKMPFAKTLEEIPKGAVSYFVPGHLPSKLTEYKRKFRSLTSTYLTFSPDGNTLLVNLGGEQIYLYPMINDLQSKVTKISIPEVFNDNEQTLMNEQSNLKNGFAEYAEKVKNMNDVLSPKVLQLKENANEAYASKKFLKAIFLYNEAIKMNPNSAILFANRAAALIERNFDGDSYSALSDCENAIRIDSTYYKAYMRKARCLFELKRLDEASSCLKYYKERFPSKTDAVKKLQDSLEIALKNASSSPPASSTSTSTSSSTTTTRTEHIASYFLRSNSSNSTDSNDEDNSADESSRSYDITQKLGKKIPEFFEFEKQFQSESIDFDKRFLGHCNTTTDIKEANFLGQNYIAAGSDDGTIFIWDKSTTNIVKILKADESICNCVQFHPSTCLLATSGIENVVRLWAPLAVDEKNDREVTDMENSANVNQKRMNSNPFEVILMNMGYRISGDGDGEDDENQSNDNNRSNNEPGSGASTMQCNPS